MTDADVVVLGAGIAGLGAALALERAGCDVLVVDAGERPGGVMATDRRGGYLVERGPNTLLRRPALERLLHWEGLEEALLRAAPASRRRFLLHEGRLEPVPMGPLAFLRTPLLSARGKLRLLAEPFVPGGDPGGESVATFLSRRLGHEVVERLVAPALTGIYAGDERRLGSEAVLPSLVELEREHGSLVRGALVRGVRRLLGRRGRPAGAGRAGTWSLPGGLGELAARLAARLRRPVETRTRAIALAAADRGWRIELHGPEREWSLRAARVVVATPAREAATLLRSSDAALAEALAGIDYAPIVAAGLGVAPADLRTRVEGFGFLVPRQAGLGLLGCLFMSQLFPGRAPAGRELLHVMLGGTRWREAVDEPDDVLRKRIEMDLDRTLGLCGAPEHVGLYRWPRAVAQPDAQHVARILDVRARAARLSGVALAGGYLDGVSVSDALASGLRAARDLAPAA